MLIEKEMKHPDDKENFTFNSMIEELDRPPAHKLLYDATSVNSSVFYDTSASWDSW